MLTNDMIWEPVGRGQNTMRNEIYIAVRGNGLKFSSAFAKVLKLTRRDFRYVSINRNNENLCLLLTFLTNSDMQTLKERNGFIDNIYELQGDGGKKKTNDILVGGPIINSRVLIRETVWLDKISKEPRHVSRRFALERQGNTYQWLMRCMPVFVNESSADICMAKQDTKGIYRFLDDHGETLYIGQGNIAKRFKCHQRDKEITASVFQWTAVEEKAMRLRADQFHLKTFVDTHGRLPRYNRILGHSAKETASVDIVGENLSAS